MELDPFAMALLRGLDFAGANDEDDLDIARAAVQSGIDGLLNLTADRVTGCSHLVAKDADRLESYYGRVIADSATGRAHLGLPLPKPAAAPDNTNDKLDRLLARQEATDAAIAEMAANARAKIGPLFSEASSRYCEVMAKAKGEDHKEIAYLRHRTKVFIKLVGDKPVTEYTSGDLDIFVDEIRFLPKNISSRADYDIARVEEYIAAGKADETAPRLQYSTIRNNYVGKIATILRDGCRTAGTPFALAGYKNAVVEAMPRGTKKLLLDYGQFDALFKAVLQTGNFSMIFLIVLGFLTGRRLGLLVYLRREFIHFHNGVWMITPRDVIKIDGKTIRVPIKTTESMVSFVLPNFLERIGLISFLQSKGPGFIFEELHEGKIKRPSNAAQKRMSSLFNAIGFGDIFKKFHGLRDKKIDAFREANLAGRTIRLQVGHELGDVHENYGSFQLRPSEVEAINSVELPKGIKWEMFYSLDFEALWAHRVTLGRKKKA